MRGENSRLSRAGAMLGAMGVILISAIILTAMTIGNSTKAVNNAAEKMWEYIDGKYEDINVKNHGEKPLCTGPFSYSLLVSDADCRDICFYVYYTNSNICDDYNHRVGDMTNTFIRLENEMGEHYKNLLAASDTDIEAVQIVLSPRVRNDIPDSIYLGVEFDPAHPIFRDSTMTLVCSATDDMEYMAQLIGKVHAIAKENGNVFSQYCVYGTESDNSFSLEINGVDFETAENEQLAEILRAAMNDEPILSETDISVSLY